MPQKLTPTELQTALADLPQWTLTNGELVRTITLNSFLDAVALVNRIADLAEAAGHHPDIDIRYSKVRLALVTHDAGGITSNDTAMAAQLDALLIL